MRTYNTIYQNKNILYDFILNNSIEKEKNILIQVFCGIYAEEFINNIRNELLEFLPHAKIIGATTGGEIFQGKKINNSCIMSFSVFENTNISTYSVRNKECSSFKLGQKLASNLMAPNTKLLVLFATSEHTNGEEFLNGIDSIANKVITAGGLAGNDTIFSNAIVFTEGETIKNGAVGASFNSENLYVYTDYTFGWFPISMPLTITKSTDNIIHTIENMPAAEIYRKYLGEEILAGLPQSGYEFPLIFKRNNRDVSRVIVNHLEDDSFVCTSSVIEGEKIRLGYGNLKTIIESGLETCERINNKPLESIFIYSCAARQMFLDSLVEKEMLPLTNNMPLSGFFTFGEFSYLDNRSQFVSQTMTILGLSESVDAKFQVNYEAAFENDNSEIISNKALYNLIQIAVDELTEINSNLEEKVKIKTEELRNQFYTDSLTKLPNRIKLIEDLSNMYLPKLSILNIDNFREVNEFYGHYAGDYILLELSKLLKSFAKKYGIQIYRLPSDEFGFLTNETISEKEFIYLMKTLSDLIEKEYFLYQNNELHVNVSIGIVANEENMIEKANMALRFAKHRDESIKIYTDDLLVSFGYEKNIKWSKKVLNAIEDDRITPYFQPIYNNQTKEITKYEVLVRMIDENGTIISPIEFLDISKKVRLYPQLTRIMINKTLDMLLNTKYTFSINLTVEDILNKVTRTLIREKLADRSIAQRVIFELVESEGIDNYDEVIDFINEIHFLGGKVAIDDFGTGYSNFEYILKLNVDYIKIDGSMIKNIHTSLSSQLITEAIVNFASKLGIEVIAEFVHCEDVFNKVLELGINFSQGYFIGQPASKLVN